MPEIAKKILFTHLQRPHREVVLAPLKATPVQWQQRSTVNQANDQHSRMSASHEPEPMALRTVIEQNPDVL